MWLDADKSYTRTSATSNAPDRKTLDEGSMKTTRAMGPGRPILPAVWTGSPNRCADGGRRQH